MFPHAQITAIEIDPENFEPWGRNTANYHNITPINMALWYCDTYLHIVNPTDKKTAIRIDNRQTNKTDGIKQSLQKIF